MSFLLFGKRRKVKPLFVGSYGNDLTRGIYVFHVDIENGEILKKKFYKSPANPTALFRRERYIYVCYKNSTGRPTDGGLWQYANMDLQFGLAAKVSHEGKTFMDSYVNEDRTYAYAVDYYNNEIVTIPIIKQKIIKVSQVLKHSGHGLDERRQDAPHPHYIDETPDHKRLFVCDLGTDEVVMYEVVEKGKLQRDDEHSISLKPGSGPKKMIFSPDGHFAYVLNELSNTVAIYQYHDCQLTYVDEVDTYDKSQYDGLSLAGDILIDDDGDYLFVSNRGYDSVSAFQIDKETGRLTYVDNMETDEHPRSMILMENRWLIVASQKGGSLETFEIKRHERKSLIFETHFAYMVGEPVCLVEGRGF